MWRDRKEKIKGITEIPFDKITKAFILESILVFVNLLLSIYLNVYFMICSLAVLAVNTLLVLILLRRVLKQEVNRTADLSGGVGIYMAACILEMLGGVLILLCGISNFFFDFAVQDKRLVFVTGLLTFLQTVPAVSTSIRLLGYKGIRIGTAIFINWGRLAILLNVFVGCAFGVIEVEDSSLMIGLTGIVTGVMVIFLAIYMGAKNMMAQEKYRELYRHFRKNQTIITMHISLRKDVVIIIGKIALGIWSRSVFMFVNALYSVGMGVAKYLVLKAQKKGREGLIRNFLEAGVAIIGASLCYVLYSIRLFVNGTAAKYDMIIALVIAVYTFTELFLVVKDFIKAKKEHNLASEQVKLIGLASILICVVLTQVAIMSFAQSEDPTFYNGLSGVIFGGLAALIGVYMILRYRYLRKDDNF